MDTGRNGFRQPNFYRTDMRITKRFRVGTRSAEMAFDAFNLFNNNNPFVNLTNRRFSGNPNAGVPNEQIGGSRQGQVSLRFQF